MSLAYVKGGPVKGTTLTTVTYKDFDEKRWTTQLLTKYAEYHTFGRCSRCNGTGSSTGKSEKTKCSKCKGLCQSKCINECDKVNIKTLINNYEFKHIDEKILISQLNF